MSSKETCADANQKDFVRPQVDERLVVLVVLCAVC
jgi:hypothetical protein